MNLSLIRVLSLWLSSSFWLNYPHTEIKVAVFLLLISICSNYNMWVRVVQKYKRTKSDSEFKAHVDWTGWGQWLWWSPDYLVKYLMKWWPESHEVWWGYSWNAHNNFPKKSPPARCNNSTSTRRIHGFKTMYLTDFGEIFFILVQPWSWPWDFGVNVYTIFSLRVSKTWVKAQSTATESCYHVCRLFNRVGRINVGGVRSNKPQLSLGSISYFILWQR